MRKNNFITGLIFLLIIALSISCGNKSKKLVYDGDQARIMNKYSEAEKLYLEAQKIDPSNALAYNNYGVLLQIQKHWEASLKNFKKALTLFKDNKNKAIVLNNIGLNFDLQGKYKEAKPYYGKSITLNPTYYESYTNLGSVYLALNQYDEAIKIFSKAMTLIEQIQIVNKVYAIQNTSQFMVLAFIKKGDTEHAEQILDSLVQMNPFNDTNYSFLGDIYLLKKDFKKAKQQYEKALSIKNNSLNALLGYALTLANMKDFTNALKNIDAARLLNDKSALLYINSGKIYSQMKKHDKAMEEWKKGLKLHPNNEDLKVLIAGKHSKQKK